MHSRKPRLNDGYYESQSRSYQNSKYNSSSRYPNYYRERDSPPKRVAHRSASPEGSPRDGRDRYHQTSSYRNKDREREYKKDKYSEKRGRDRDVEYKNYSTKKAKLRERSSSDEEHKESDRLYDKSRYSERDASRRAPEKERRFGDWKEMISKGSGKKYYYNERDKSSQWEKPDEWTEYEMAKEYSSARGYRDKDRDRKSRDDRYNSGGRRSYSSSKHSRGNSRGRWPHEPYGVQPSTSSSMGHHKRHDENADMDISPESTPTSEPSYASPTANNQHVNSSNVNSNSLNHDDSVVTSPNGHAKHSSINSNNQLHHQMSNASSSSISSANRLLSNSNKHSTIASSSPSTHNYASYHSSHHHRHRSVSPNELNSSTHHNNVGHETNNMHHNSISLRNSPSYGGTNNSVTSGGLVHSASRVDLSSSNHLCGDGPPTPEMDLNSAGDHRRIDGASGVSSLQSVMAASQTSNRINLITPSLAKFFRADLITHVTNWPSEVFEKQAQKCAEDVYMYGDLEGSRISTEIQCARSHLRVEEIHATIQGQRRLFLQEQIKSLEESQTQNSSQMSY